jgi:sn-glycerol 3-phosphate transport system permease protein
MIENRPWLTAAAHAILILGVAVIAFPLYVTLIASTHTLPTLLTGRIPLLPGAAALGNYSQVLGEGLGSAGAPPVMLMLLNSLAMALGISLGKIAISIIAAYAIVYFQFPLRMTCFWLIFATLMLPVEVRILPTYKVVSDLGMLDSYAGLIVPLIASATATFLFRQFFLSVPEELTEAARIDGAGPIRFFTDILLPLSRTSIAALFVIQFIYGWNQYLWPLIVTTKQSYYTVVMTISRMVNVVDVAPSWNLIMATALLAMLPPVLVVLVMQRWFVKGLVETEK